MNSPVVVWNLEPSCNLSCRHCYAESDLQKDVTAISTSKAKEFIDDLASLNIPALLFSGGEPLLREDIFELGQYAHEKGIYTALSTNGTLITEDVVKKIKKSQFSYAGISLDGLETTHDNFRAKEGSFQMTIKGIENCLKAGIKTGARFTLSRHNYKDLDKLILLLAEKGVNRFCLYHLVYSEEGRANPEDDIDNDTKRKVLDSFFDVVDQIVEQGINMEILTVDNHADGVYLYSRLKERDEQLASRAHDLILNGSGCSAGSGVVSIDAHGNVHPCQFWRHVSLGNIQERRFSEIWNDDNNEFLNMLRNGKSKLKGKCGRCKYKISCGGCRLRAEKKFGDLWAEDPACYLTEEEIQ